MLPGESCTSAEPEETREEVVAQRLAGGRFRMSLPQLQATMQRLCRLFVRKSFCRHPRGVFPNRVLGEFCGRFFGGFFRALFPWKKLGGKNPRKNPPQNSYQNLGVSRPKSTPVQCGLVYLCLKSTPGLVSATKLLNNLFWDNFLLFGDSQKGSAEFVLICF